MKENRQSPEIRMEGFEDDWIYNNLRKLAIFNPKTEPPEEFEYVDLESVVGTEMMYHRKEKRDTAPSRAQRVAQYGDLFYQTVRPYQKIITCLKKRNAMCFQRDMHKFVLLQQMGIFCSVLFKTIVLLKRY